MRARVLALSFAVIAGCSSSDPSSRPVARDPDTTAVVSVDRFSDAFAHLFARSQSSALPAANAPIDFDSGAPFITHGFAPDGHKVTYYNFDVLPATPAPIYVLFAAGASAPIAGQLNIIDVIPGDVGYNDFWNVVKVTVPAGYLANSVTSAAALVAAGYPMEKTSMLVNCPVVPAGSQARLRYSAVESPALARGWYKDQVVNYFSFGERALSVTASGAVPVSDIFVTFNVNPDASTPGSGPPSGFVTEAGTMQTHNITRSVPEDSGYSPLWDVNIYDNSAFAGVSDLTSVMQAPLLVPDAALVNCPIVASR
jgi:hypothetical protein